MCHPGLPLLRAAPLGFQDDLRQLFREGQRIHTPPECLVRCHRGPFLPRQLRWPIGLIARLARVGLNRLPHKRGQKIVSTVSVVSVALSGNAR